MIVMDISIARKYIETLYLDKCDIYEYRTVVNSDDYTTGTEEVLVHKDVPCKMSCDSRNPSYDGVSESQYQRIKLIVNPEIEIKAGSRIVVTRGGKSISYNNSGTPAKFFNHQEITLIIEEDDA